MKRHPFLLLCFLISMTAALAQKSPKSTVDIPLSYYLPEGFNYNSEIPEPQDFFGFQVGEWNPAYEQILRYFEKLAESSPRAEFQIIGYTYEKRPQAILTISAPSNINQLDQIKADRKKLRDPDSNIDYTKTPLVMAAGYSVHGNEASAISSSILAAYHFVAAQEIENDLENIIVMIDPALNPDGYSRYSTWVNSHRSYNLNGDKNNRELSEAWPGGRGNHYWFDLNRDWLLVQHPESRNRVAAFQEWLPNIYLDYHEMGTNSTFFFQPGIPSRDHPLTPKKNLELTEKMGNYHAKALDEIGSLYHTKESFDEYYFGYGSTYPDIQGSIGILFEQASSRGHLQESDYGPLPFAFTIRNQFRTSISSFEAAVDMREEIVKFMHDFYKESIKEATSDSNQAYIFGSTEDAARSFHLAEMILQHDIEVFALNEDITINSVDFQKEKSYIVPLKQPQYNLIKAIFETRTDFQDSLFYDVSAWTMPMSFNLDYMAMSSRILNVANVTKLEKDEKLKKGEMLAEEKDLAFAFEWSDYYAPKLAYQMLSNGHLVRVAHEPFKLESGKELQKGTIIVSTKRDAKEDAKEKLYQDLKKLAEENAINVYGISSGLTGGINLGSPNIDVLKEPKIALLVSMGVNSLEAGEIWHLLDQRMDIPITLLATERLSSSELDKYTVIAMPNGTYSNLGEKDFEKLKSWISSGGTLVARGGALAVLDKQKVVSFEFKKEDEDSKKELKPYEDFVKNTGARLTRGTIFHAKLDTSHPLGYGYSKPEIYSFRNDNQFLEQAENPYSNPLIYTENPLASGYIHPENLEFAKNTAALQVKSLGQGKVIAFGDSPNFRAIWFGTNKLYLN
ncbi:MAG: zinc carboxypeptidase, partial [Mongoliibacter sp.]|uniref:M14 family zinc carboxypeptidase n=1 Tax=Mongoliibacter sp. TaxID=2022438 RepID=UPI0012F0B16A